MLAGSHCSRAAQECQECLECLEHLEHLVRLALRESAPVMPLRWRLAAVCAAQHRLRQPRPTLGPGPKCSPGRSQFAEQKRELGCETGEGTPRSAPSPAAADEREPSWRPPAMRRDSVVRAICTNQLHAKKCEYAFCVSHCVIYMQPGEVRLHVALPWDGRGGEWCFAAQNNLTRSCNLNIDDDSVGGMRCAACKTAWHGASPSMTCAGVALHS